MGTPRQDNHGSSAVKPITKPYGRIVLTLKNCLLPEDKLSPTPSQNDGLDQETEADLRILGCELIQTAGILLKLPQVAMATGQVLFQRFYYSKSFVRHAMETTAMGCICLASKIEEAPRRIRDVINVFHHIKQVKSQKTIQPMILDQNYIALKTQVIKAERRVLKELGFCVHVKHPHKIIVLYLQVLGFEKHQNLMQLAWNYMNDSLRTDVFVRYQPETIACACIYLSSRKLNISLPKSPAWFSIFCVSEEDIQDVCFRILRLYKRPKPNAEDLDRRVEELRRHYQEARMKARGGSGSGTGGTGAQSGNNTPGGGSNSPNSPHSRSRHGSPTRSSKDKHHNSGSPRWGGGFIRQDVSFAFRNNHTSDKHRSRSRSRTASHSPPPKHSKKSKKNRTRSVSHSRSRSRSHERKSKKSHKRRSYSRSPSLSPHKNTRKVSRDKGRYRSRSRSHDGRRGVERSRSQSYDHYDKYYSSSDKLSSKSRSKHSSRGLDDDRIRSKDRR
ncbi:hypothetical protein Cfor_08658 [Coptotermes formosanus]|uniref:Cyclin-like domain-containing protein n=1 Tax=Coptotermes formosanus TaxID=36987 RepID=A0A6L2Q4R2_COPFO|nr:hypothetical protein Cfor_08658 [Coptotermes formosanus]